MKNSTCLLKLSILLSLLAIVSTVVLDSYGVPIDTELHCDDCSSGNVLPAGYSIKYFGEVYDLMYISSNGMISLGCGDVGDQLTFDTLPIIAPYMSDINTELVNNLVDGTVFYRTELGGDTDFDTFVHDHFGINFLTVYEVVATWDRVKQNSDDSSARNTFQAVIYVSSYGDTSICFNYPADGLNWPTSASTDYPLVGFYSGPDLNLLYTLPGSGTSAAVNLDSITGNTGNIGEFCYLVSGLEVIDSCLITELDCAAPHYFPINTPITVFDVLTNFNLCNDQTLHISVGSLTCADLGNIVPVTATAGSVSCTTYLIPQVNTQFEYINCPADITVYSNDPTTVHWVPPTAVGDCLNPGQETISDHPDSTLFDLGETLVTYTAYDVNLVATVCSFEVTVLPQITILYQVIDVMNRPISGASIAAVPIDCAPTDTYGECYAVAPTLRIGDIIPAGIFYVTFNGITYPIPHSDITVNCALTQITIVISPPGFYRSVGGDIIACSAGTYSTIYEAANCLSCPAGTYTDDLFATFCEICPIGYTSSDGATECYSCSAGYFLNIFTNLCEICPAGTFSCDRSLECTPCADGSYSLPGSTACSFCAAGYYLTNGACESCPEGTFSGDRATECTACPYGSWADEGSSECFFCVAGFYLDYNLKECVPCPGGYISCDRATECTICPEGGFASPGSSVCEFCEAGFFMGMNETQTVCGCSPCPAGTFSCDRAEMCEPCPPGTWSLPGSAFCFTCYAGYYLDIDCGECLLCPANTFSADFAVECTPCPFGSYAFPGSTSCIFCNEGYYFDGDTCELCPAGTFSGDRATECTPCPPGSYSFEGSSACIYCTAGYFFDDSSSSCLACPAGTYSCDRAVTCDICPPGSFSYPGSAICLFCDQGYYLDENSGFCVACPAGTFSNSRATICTPCAPGFYSLPGSSTCYSCTAGFYLEASGDCIPCPDGTTSGDRATSCFPIPNPQNEEIFCFAGFCFDPPTNSCLPCPANTYSLDRALVCTACPFGSYSPVAASACIFCTAGYYLSDGICAPCPANTYSTDRATYCIPCPEGYVSSAASMVCTPCPQGSVVSPIDGNCEYCADGYYNVGNLCISCSSPIPEVCLICPPGTESDVVCEECCAGYYSSDGHECLPCPEGTYSGNAFSECVTCPDGYVWSRKDEQCVSLSSCTDRKSVV